MKVDLEGGKDGGVKGVWAEVDLEGGEADEVSG